MTTDFSLETIETRRKWHNVYQVLNEELLFLIKLFRGSTSELLFGFLQLFSTIFHHGIELQE